MINLKHNKQPDYNGLRGASDLNHGRDRKNHREPQRTAEKTVRTLRLSVPPLRLSVVIKKHPGHSPPNPL